MTAGSFRQSAGDLDAVRKAMTGKNGRPRPNRSHSRSASVAQHERDEGGNCSLPIAAISKSPTTHCRVVQYDSTGRCGACLASQCRRVGNTTSRARPHGRVNTGPHVVHDGFNPGESDTSLATTDIMCRTSATPTCKSRRVRNRIFRRSPGRTGLSILCGNGGGASERRHDDGPAWAVGRMRALP